MIQKPNRREFLKTTATAAAVGAVAPTALGAAPAAAFFDESNIYTRKLGIKPVINGVGTVTVLGGSIMPPEVIQAMVEAARYFVPLPELQEKVGARIAELLDIPAAMISCGAASAITCATAASIVRGDGSKVRQLPDTTGLPHEVIQQKSHRHGYEGQIELTGARIVTVETRQELDAAINERTAMMFFLNKADPDGQINREEWIRVGKKHGIPTFNDAAADVPPPSRLSEYVKMGFDLVTFSGGKGLIGPQATGLLLGRGDLVAAARMAMSPHGGIGRGMKVGKEEMMGVLVALERYLKVDHAAERREMEAKANHVIQTLSGLPGVKAEHHVPVIANEVPHVVVQWQPGQVTLTSKTLLETLDAGDPPIRVSANGEEGIRISMWMLRGEEHKVVADRLKQILSASRA